MSLTALARPDRIITSASTVTLSGQVIDTGNNPLERVVVVCNANDLSVSLGITSSNPVTGYFSFVIPGTATTEFACIVQGEMGENCVVHSHKTAD